MRWQQLVGWLLMCTLPGVLAAERFQRGEFAFERTPAPSFVKEQSLKGRWPADLDGGGVRWWLNDTQEDLRDGRQVLYRRLVGEASSNEALDQVAQPQIDFDPSYQTLRIHEISVLRGSERLDRFKADGITLARRELDADNRGIYTGRVTAMIVIDDVRVGDRVTLAYSLDGRHPVLGERAGDEYALALPVPMRARRIRVLADAEPGVDVRVASGYAEPALSTHADEIELNYVADAVPALKIESQQPAWIDPIPSLQIARRGGWPDIAHWATTLYPPPASSAALDAEVTRLAALSTDQTVRAEAALRFVQDEIRYLSLSLGESTHRPAEPDRVLERRFGDCKDKSRLLVTLLTRLGIEAHPVLVNSTRGEALPDLLPRAGVFDHVIVHMRIADEDWWVDPTATLQRGGLKRQGFPDFAWGLIVAPTTTALSPLQRPAGSRDGHELSEQYTVESSAAELSVQSRWVGAYAEWMRRRLAADGRQAVREALQSSYARLHGQAEALGELSVADDEAANELTLSDRYRIPEFIQRRDTAQIFEVSATIIGEFFPLPEKLDREAPLGLVYPAHIVQTIAVELPKDVLPALDHESLSLSDAGMRFERTAKLSAGRFDARFEIESLASSVSGSGLSEHLEHRRQLSNALGLAVKVARQGDRRQQREERMRALLKGTASTEPGDGRQ